MRQSESTESSRHSPHTSSHCQFTRALPDPVIVDRGSVIAVCICSLSVCLVSVLLFCLLKPISDIISGTGNGIGAAFSTTGAGVAFLVNTTLGGLSSLGKAHSADGPGSLQCHRLGICSPAPFPNEQSENMVHHPLTMTALIETETQDVFTMKLHIANVSNGVVFEVLKVEMELFDALFIEAGFDQRLPPALRSKIASEFQQAKNEAVMFRSKLYAVNDAGWDTLMTYKDQLETLDPLLYGLWRRPSSTSFEQLQERLEQFRDVIDEKIEVLKQEVDASKLLAESMNGGLDELKSFTLEASRLLPDEQTRLEYCAETLGFSQKLQYSMARLKSFSHFIDQTVKPLIGLRDLVEKMDRHSDRFKVHSESLHLTIILT
ncbi:uncharacterized protein EV420DRAFT_539124 [Desarmillaria tabescens]|uniref:Uncharacterized protein n=1 Tax=Armillaria tabescens TaxID=1929756 RepID=A0AA39N4F5_ARMTA|nr:uncharacterized protein EV420DRAFT_539124 [Desarmillaria tabescens]KAK0457083.1 hypothetical protein EV420DRAFT_539124 [Desarmillaria tabescens]